MRLNGYLVEQTPNTFDLGRQFFGAMADKAVIGGADQDNFAIYDLHLDAGRVDHFMVLQTRPDRSCNLFVCRRVLHNFRMVR